MAGVHLDEDDVIINLDIDVVVAGDGVGLLPVRGCVKRPDAGAVRAPVHLWVPHQQGLQKLEVLHVVCAHRKHHLE